MWQNELDLTPSLDKRIVNQHCDKIPFSHANAASRSIGTVDTEAHGIVGPNLDHCDNRFCGMSEQNYLKM
jgi:hypothetical protein